MSNNTSINWGAVGQGAAGAAASGIVGSLFGIGSRRKAYHRSKKLMDKRFDMDKQMWDYQNAYNTPAAQMKRLKQAGLNPALMYGQGNTGNASQMPSSQFQELSPYHTPADFAQSSAAGVQMSLVGAQRSNIEADTTFKSIKGAVEAGHYGIAKEMSKYQMANLSKDLEVKDSQTNLNNVNVELAKQNISLTGFKKMEISAMIDKIKTDTRLNNEIIKEYEKGFSRNYLASLGNLFTIDSLKTPEGKAKAVTSLAVAAMGKAGKIATALKGLKQYILSNFK